MRHWQVRDVMTANPMTVTPATPLKDVVGILVRGANRCRARTHLAGPGGRCRHRAAAPGARRRAGDGRPQGTEVLNEPNGPGVTPRLPSGAYLATLVPSIRGLGSWPVRARPAELEAKRLRM